jgi:hypothetical protein
LGGILVSAMKAVKDEERREMNPVSPLGTLDVNI